MATPTAAPAVSKWCRNHHDKEEYKRMLLSLEFCDIQGEIREEIIQAYNHPIWDWTKCDGCTLVNELYFPVGMRFPPCVVHDMYCSTMPKSHRRRGDRRFLVHMKAYRVSRCRRWVRWLGVRSFWLGWRRWRV